MRLRAKKVVTHWIVAWVFAILLGEVTVGIVFNKSIFGQYFVPIISYYAVITLIFSVLFNKFRL